MTMNIGGASSLTYSEWKSCIVADEGTASAECNLGAPYKYVTVLNPTIDSAYMSVQGAMTSGGTFYPVHAWNDPGYRFDGLTGYYYRNYLKGSYISFRWLSVCQSSFQCGTERRAIHALFKRVQLGGRLWLTIGLPDATSGSGTGNWSATGATGHWADDAGGTNLGKAAPALLQQMTFTLGRLLLMVQDK